MTLRRHSERSEESLPSVPLMASPTNYAPRRAPRLVPHSPHLRVGISPSFTGSATSKSRPARSLDRAANGII